MKLELAGHMGPNIHRITCKILRSDPVDFSCISSLTDTSYIHVYRPIILDK